MKFRAKKNDRHTGKEQKPQRAWLLTVETFAKVGSGNRIGACFFVGHVDLLKIAFSPCDIVDAFPYITVYTYIFHVGHLLISDGNSLHRILDIINFADSFFASMDESSFYGSSCSMMR